ILRVVSVEYARPRLLAGISAGAADRRRGGDRYRAPLSAPHLPPRPPLRTAADLWFGANHRGGFPPAIRVLGPALRDPARAAGRPQSRLYVSAELPRLGDHRLARGVPCHLVHH